MKTKNIFIIAIAALIATILFYSFNGDSDKDYIASLNNSRKAKDEQMRNGEDSPFGDEKKNFKHLNYFSPDLNYRISAKLTPIEHKKMVVLSTSDGKEKRYLEYAYAEFELNHTPGKLLILEIPEGEYKGVLFLAFADETSANETYGAGRYIELKKTPGASSITIDFNEAYNPYCAYADSFSCPFPPRENILKMAVRAGEKNYHE
ncbi:MAG TPA: DUF1684 domain-containing protein [Cyclobacteriaceae bacterium]|nr:DUF1684 domain-containing protein [Cyclobacteriaceae bacterium]